MLFGGAGALGGSSAPPPPLADAGMVWRGSSCKAGAWRHRVGSAGTAAEQAVWPGSRHLWRRAEGAGGEACAGDEAELGPFAELVGCQNCAVACDLQFLNQLVIFMLPARTH
jgi:hypothetical protein